MGVCIQYLSSMKRKVIISDNAVIRNAYLSLLRASIWDTPPELDGTVDWNSVLCVADMQTTLAVICQAALQVEGSNAPSQEMRMSMLGIMGQKSSQNAFLNGIMKRAIGLIRTHGIEPVLLKGAGLALNYPIPEFRQCGDIDLYVGEKNYHEGCAALREMTDFQNYGMENERQMHYNVVKDIVNIELHRVSAVLRDAKDYAFYLEIERKGLSENLHRVDIDGISVSLPSDTFNVFYVFHHAWGHFLEQTGVGFRQLCDWTLLLHSLCGNLDLDELKSYLDGLGLMKAWKTFGCIAVFTLGLPKEEMPFFDPSFEKKASKVLEYVWRDGNFGGEWKPSKKSRLDVVSRLKTGLHVVFYGFEKLRYISFGMACRETAKKFRFYLRKVPKYLSGELRQDDE